MTVTTSTARVVHNGNGTTTQFAVPFRFLENAQVAVFLRDVAGGQTLWAENTQYTLSGADAAGGGTLTVVISPTDHTPATGEKLVVIRAVPITQETDYVENDPFPAETHERALDKLTMVNQEQTERLDRTFTIPESDSSAGDFVLPIDGLRASKFLAFDSLGNPIVAAGTSADLGPVSGFIGTLLTAADAATARTTLEAQRNVISARGDLVVGNATPAESRLAIGGNGQVLTSDGADALWVTPAINPILMAAAPPEISNGTDAVNDIDFAANACRDELNTANMPAGAALTKRIDAVWVEGDNQGGFPSGLTLGSPVNDTTYHAFKIAKPDGTVDYGFDSSLTAVNLLADAIGYTTYRLLGSILYGTATIRPFVQTGDFFRLVDPVEDFNANNTGTADVLREISSPIGRKLLAKVVGQLRNTTNTDCDMHLRSADVSTAGPAELSQRSGDFTRDSIVTDCMTDTFARVKTKLNRSGTNYRAVGGCLGWQDRRGRDN